MPVWCVSIVVGLTRPPDRARCLSTIALAWVKKLMPPPPFYSPSPLIQFGVVYTSGLALIRSAEISVHFCSWCPCPGFKNAKSIIRTSECDLFINMIGKKTLGHWIMFQARLSMLAFFLAGVVPVSVDGLRRFKVGAVFWVWATSPEAL